MFRKTHKMSVSPSGCVPPRPIMTADKSKRKRYSFYEAQLRTLVNPDATRMSSGAV
jgi:hypothetical protein